VQLVEGPVGPEAHVDTVEHGGEPLDHTGEPGDHLAEVRQHPTAARRPGIVHDRLEAQHVFAVGVARHRQQPEVDLEHGRVPPRFLDHDRRSRREVAAGLAVRAVAHAEQRAQRGHVQPGPGPVDDGVEDPLHHRAGGKEQVAAVLDLVDLVVAEATAA
jgi:hypothetical protein